MYCAAAHVLCNWACKDELSPTFETTIMLSSLKVPHLWTRHFNVAPPQIYKPERTHAWQAHCEGFAALCRRVLN